MSERSALLQRYLQGGAGSDYWFRQRNQNIETRLGFFRVQVVNKRWWIIDPQNQPFISLGICHIAYKGSDPMTVPADSTEEGYSPYAETVDRRYDGDAEAWASYQVKRLSRWGFNTIGCWSSPELFQQGMPYTVFMHISRYAGVDRAQRHRGEFPDVFSDTWNLAAEQSASDVCALRKDDPLLIGYFTDNEHDWDGWRRGTSLFDYFMGKGAEAPGKQALVQQLSERYGGDAAHLSANWDVPLSRFDELLARTTLRPGPRADLDTVQADHRAFLALAAERYFAVSERAIRQADPNHMVLGVRFAGARVPVEVVEACGRHVDIVSVNNYSYDAPAEQLRRIFDVTWRPIMITEWSFKAMDSGLPNTKGAAIPVYTQEDRADGYQRYVTQALSLPYVVGLHWFQYTDQPLQGRHLDGENSNYGVVDTDDEPHSTLVERMRVVNARALEIAKASLPLLG